MTKKIYIVEGWPSLRDYGREVDSYWTKYEDAEKRKNLLIERDGYEVDIKSIDDKSLLRGM